MVSPGIVLSVSTTARVELFVVLKLCDGQW